MPGLRKYSCLLHAIALCLMAIALVAGCSEIASKGRGGRLAAVETDDAFLLESLRQEITEIDSLYEAGNMLLMESDFQRLLEREHEWTGRLDAGEYAWLYDWIGEFHHRLGNLVEARRNSELAFSRLDSIQDIDFKTHVLNNLAITEGDLGNFNRALELLFKAMDYYKTDTVNRAFIDFYNNIGNVYSVSKNYDLAIYYFEKLITLADKLGLEEEYGYYHGNLGYTYYAMGKFEQSISHLQQAKTHFAQYEQFNDELLLNTLLASNYLALGRVDDAERLLQGNLQEAENKQLWEIYVETAISLFELHVAKGDERAAFAAIDEGLKKIHFTNTTRLQLKIYDKLIAYHEDKRDFGHAFAYLKRRNGIQDSVADASKSELMRDLAVKYETDRKNDQIAQLSMLNEEERRTNAIYLVGLMLLVGIVVLIFWLLRRISMQKRALEETNRTKDRLFSIIAHDLRSPMIALRGMGDLLSHYIDQKDERKLVALADKTGQTLARINHLLDNLLNWAVTNSDRIAYNPIGQEVGTLVGEALSIHRTAAEAKQLQLETKLEPMDVFVDLNMAASILRNVISNAIKYSPSGGTITVAGTREGGHYRVGIADEGGGVPQQVIDGLHQPDGVIMSGGGKESFGLGLRLAMYFATMNHGKFAIKNQGKGALVEIWLPLKHP